MCVCGGQCVPVCEGSERSSKLRKGHWISGAGVAVLSCLMKVPGTSLGSSAGMGYVLNLWVVSPAARWHTHCPLLTHLASYWLNGYCLLYTCTSRFKCVRVLHIQTSAGLHSQLLPLFPPLLHTALSIFAQLIDLKCYLPAGSSRISLTPAAAVSLHVLANSPDLPSCESLFISFARVSVGQLLSPLANRQELFVYAA